MCIVLLRVLYVCVRAVEEDAIAVTGGRFSWDTEENPTLQE